MKLVALFAQSRGARMHNVYAKRRGHMGSPAWPPRKLPRVHLSILLGRNASMELNAQSSSDP